MDVAPTTTPFVKTKKERELTNDERIEIVSQLIGMSLLPQLPYGAITKVAKNFEVSQSTVSRLWSGATLSRLANKVVKDEVFPLSSSRNGGKNKSDIDELHPATKEISRKKRKTYRALAKRLGVPKTTILR